MVTPTCEPLRHHDSLSRDHLLHVSGDSHPALKIAIGTLLGALLALAGIFSGPPQSVDRFAPLETVAPPQIAVDRDGPWDEGGR